MLYRIQQNEETGIYYLWEHTGQGAEPDGEHDGRAHAFAAHGQGAEEVGQVLAICKAYFEADTLVACPGPGKKATVLQDLCNTHITFTPTARRRRGRPSAASEKKRLRIKGTRQQIRRALLVAELADTGNTLAIFAELAREKGAAEVVPFAIGHTPGIARPIGFISLGRKNGRVDLAGLARHLGIGKRRVQQLIKSEILPPPKGQRYDKDKATRAYIRFLRDHGNLGLKSYTEEKTRLTKAQADEKELKNDLLRAQLIPADQVHEVWAGHIIHAKTKFLALPDKLGPEIAAMDKVPEIKAYLRRFINEILNDLAASQVEE